MSESEIIYNFHFGTDPAKMKEFLKGYLDIIIKLNELELKIDEINHKFKPNLDVEIE